MSRTNYQGRHRTSPATSSAVPRIAGNGLLLPTAAAATLVLTATGAHLGTGNGALSATAQAQTQSLLADQQGNQDATIDALTTRSRSVQDRTSRDTDREKLDAVAQETANRAADEQARQANPQVQQIADVPADVPAGTSSGAGVAPSGAYSKTWVPLLSAGYTLTSGFGMRWGAMHPGQDFAIPLGTPVKAMSSGTVVFAGWSGGYGNKVEIKYWDGTVSWYAHNSQVKVSQGQKVSPGQVVALSGNTGHSTGPHVHVEIHPNDGTPVSPIGWLKQNGIMP